MTSYNLIAFTFLGKYVITLLDIVFLFARQIMEFTLFTSHNLCSLLHNPIVLLQTPFRCLR